MLFRKGFNVEPALLLSLSPFSLSWGLPLSLYHTSFARRKSFCAVAAIDSTMVPEGWGRRICYRTARRHLERDTGPGLNCKLARVASLDRTHHGYDEDDEVLLKTDMRWLCGQNVDKKLGTKLWGKAIDRKKIHQCQKRGLDLWEVGRLNMDTWTLKRLTGVVWLQRSRYTWCKIDHHFLFRVMAE